MLNLDIALQIASIALTVLLAAVGLEMANHPPTTNTHRWRYRIAFIVSGLLLVGVNYWQAHRNVNEQLTAKTQALAEQKKLDAQYNEVKGKLNTISDFVAHPPSNLDSKQVAAVVRSLVSAKSNQPTKEASSVQVTSPDPYVGVSNKQVSQWAMEEADRIEKMGDACRDGVLKAQQQKLQVLPYNSFDAPGPEAVQSRFRRDFDTSVKPELAKLHDSLNLRLGPAARTREQEQDYQDIMNFSYPPTHSWELCMMVGTYANDLRQMATSLNSR